MTATATFYHSTPRQNLPAILDQGLLVSKADSAARIKGVWMCTASQRAWAILHCIRKHQVDLADVVLLELKVSRRHLTRFRRGLFYSTQDVSRDSITRVFAGASFGQSASE